ncbi:crotonase/enoyl-CoA hydratase family protein [Ravibacter arvi]|uniref:Crotonase/enoyl-CoA hydratase family protein n=1 Tax=Ravibacter arvi TaxID=2051041 RepID=A0ABP8MAQ9_9BACT
MQSPFFAPDTYTRFDPARLQYLKVEVKDYVLTLTLARPGKRNAFNQAMAEEIAFVLGYANQDTAIRCLVIKAEGPVFCAGADLNAFLDAGVQRSIPAPQRKVNLGEAFAFTYKPSIAQIEGPVLAGGFLILAGATFAYATPEVHFSLPEVKRGIWPMQVMASLSRRVPERKIMEMCMTGRLYTSAEAHQMGLLSDVINAGSIQEKVSELAGQLAASAPLAISSGMRAFQAMHTHNNQATLYRMLQEELEKLLQSEDAAEGIHAFKEKRHAVWKNR